MYCKQRFAIVVQQVQANILAQLGSNPFQPLPGATANPTTPYVGLQKHMSFLKRKIIMFCSAVPKFKGQGHEDISLPTRPTTIEITSFLLHSF